MKLLISVIFTCHKRLPLAKLCLSRFKELMPQPYELILVYDGDDVNYLHELINIIEFDYIIMNNERHNRFYLLNKALDECNGDLYMHLESDFYWEKPGVVEEAVEGFMKRPELDIIRFDCHPFKERDFKEKIQLKNDILYTFRDGLNYTSFNFSPHLRRYKFPIREFPKVIPPAWSGIVERMLSKEASKAGYRGGCLGSNGFRHLGILDEKGFYKALYNERFTLRDQSFFDPIEEFNSFCHNSYYRSLFRQYINGGKKYRISLIYADDLPDPPKGYISGRLNAGGELIIPDGVNTCDDTDMKVMVQLPRGDNPGRYLICPEIIGDNYELNLSDLTHILNLFVSPR